MTSFDANEAEPPSHKRCPWVAMPEAAASRAPSRLTCRARALSSGSPIDQLSLGDHGSFLSSGRGAADKRRSGLESAEAVSRRLPRESVSDGSRRGGRGCD